MSSCLGVYLGENVVKYAKISANDNNVKIEQCGTRIIKESKRELIANLVEETKSQDIPLILNTQNDKYIELEVYDQVQNTNNTYVDEIIKTEFDAWCEKEKVISSNFSYVYNVCDVKKDNGKRKLILNYVRTSEIDQFSIVNEKKVDAIYPSPLIINNIVPKDEKDYVLVDLDDFLSVSTVVDGKFADFRSFDVGILQVLEEFSIKVGSVAKAYEACKRINTFTEGQSDNDPQLEAILEPILQEILRYVLTIVNKNRKSISKVFIVGTGIIFTNIDILFQEYLDVKCEILKPDFAMQTTDVRNVAETIEALPAISLGYEYLVNKNYQKLSYINAPAGKKTKSNIFSSDKTIGDIAREFKLKFLNSKVKRGEGNIEEVTDVKSKEKKGKEGKKSSSKIIITDFATESLVQTITIFCIVIGMIFLTYLAFDQIYIGSINKNIADIDSKIERLQSQEKEVESDTIYTNTNMKKYKDINDQVSLVVSKIESNEIGKFSTYNVAFFLQQIIKVIPEEVQLITISSDDNKNIEIVAEADSYADLGYFVAQLKLQGILNSTTITDVKNGNRIKITIGGELP